MLETPQTRPFTKNYSFKKSYSFAAGIYFFPSSNTFSIAIKEINVMFYNFLWHDKGDKIKRKVMINDYSEGGLKMVDIASSNRSLKATWIKRYLDKENCGS